MTENMEGLELKDRLNLIENMIAEGRRAPRAGAGPSFFGAWPTISLSPGLQGASAGPPGAVTTWPGL